MDRRFFAIAIIVATAVLAARTTLAGSISGTVRAEGKKGADAEAGGGNYSSKALKTAETIDYSEIGGFIVYIEGSVPGAQLQRAVEEIHQKNAVFVPHVLPVMVGTKVVFENDDNIFHNVFSKSDAAPFDLGLYKKGDAPHAMTFAKPGEVDVFCSIHARMNCVILVLENPYFAAVRPNGEFTITNVPPGTYNVVAWQERLPKSVKSITVPESGQVTGLKFVLGPNNLPKY